MFETVHTEIMAVVVQAAADWADYPLKVIPPNRTLDLAAQDEPFIDVEIDYLPGGGQMELGSRPRVKQYGQLVLTIGSRPGTGTADTRSLADFLLPYFDMKQLGLVKLHAVQAVRGVQRNGLWVQPLWVDFEVNRPSA